MQSTTTVDLMGRLTPPARSRDQQMQALEEANRVRLARAALKRRMKRDPRVLELALELRTDELGLRDHELDTMKVFELLMATPKLGRVRVNRALNRVRISPSKTLGGMSVRQRRELLDGLPTLVRS